MSPRGNAEHQPRSRIPVKLLAILASAALLIGCQPGRTAPVDTGALEIDWSSPEELPPPQREDFRSEFVSDEDGYRFWPRSSQVTPGIAYRFDTGHCGLEFMTDLDGGFWRPIDPDGGEPPDFFYNQDVGAIALVDVNRAIYRSSGGVEVELKRLPGPVVTQPCR